MRAMAVILVAILLATQVAIPVSADLEAFFVDKIAEFPTWVRTNNLDPTPADPSEVDVSVSNVLINLDTIISNAVLKGYSEHLSVNDIQADLNMGKIFFHLSTRGAIELYGSHSTNWTFISSNISSVGSLEASYLASSSQYRGCHNMEFTVLPSGYLNLSTFDNYCELKWVPDKGSFDGISDNEVIGGYEEVVESLLRETVSRFMGRTDASPFYKVFLQYWTQVFTQTTYLDIINYTPNPELTTTPQWEDTDGITSQSEPGTTQEVTDATITYPTELTTATSPPDSEIYHHIDQIYYHLRMIEQLLPSRPPP